MFLKLARCHSHGVSHELHAPVQNWGRDNNNHNPAGPREQPAGPRVPGQESPRPEDRFEFKKWQLVAESQIRLISCPK